jgi:GNAT superfamily N-acetyltransferase
MNAKASARASRIRRIAGEEDAAAAGRLLDRFNRDYSIETPGPGFLARRVAALDGEACATFLARESGEDAGVAVVRFRPSLWDDADEAYLAELYVLPDHRRHGLGGELVETVLALARERGCRFIELGTDEGDHDAHRLYERFGFSNFTDPNAAVPERMLFFEREL